MKTYPIALVNLHQKKCVIIGGGKIAARKVKGLLEVDARIIVISPEFCPELDKLVKDNMISLKKRNYHSSDLIDAFLVITATDNPKINQQVWEDARAKNILVNVVDKPQLCNFIAPAVVRRGPLSIAISSGGNCPSLSRSIRKELEKVFGPEYDFYVRLLGEIRDLSLTSVSYENRKCLWDHLLKSNVLELIKIGELDAARELATDILNHYTPMNRY